MASNADLQNSEMSTTQVNACIFFALCAILYHTFKLNSSNQACGLNCGPGLNLSLTGLLICDYHKDRLLLLQIKLIFSTNWLFCH